MRVVNLRGKPVAGVSFLAGAASDKGGRTRIRLAAGTQAGNWVKLSIAEPEGTVLISPWNGYLRVAAQETVVVGQAGDRTLLASPPAVASMAAHALSSHDAARLYGFTPAEIERAIRELKTSDSYEAGLSKSYRKEYAEAARLLALALKEREKQLTRNAPEIVDAAVFLGQAFTALRRPADAAVAYRRAASYRPDDPEILEALGMALVNDGKPEAGEPFLRQAKELRTP